jgi:U3 small nucleolar RNA-associated protein 21
VLQVLRLGSPVTSLSLSPSQDLLATTHVERDGVYLWANQLIFGSGADVVPSETPVDARLPTVGTGRGRGRLGGGGGPGGGDAKAAAAAATRAMLRHSARAGGAAAAAEQPEDLSDGFSYGDLSASDLEVASSGGEDSDSDGGGASDSSESAGGGRAAAAAAAAAELDPAAGAPYSARDRAGAPVPLVPHLATLSMLPRTQWQNLVHLDTIKARNRPVEPPTKPAAAPFFLPTLVGANAGRTPVFDPAAAPDQADDQEADPELVARAAAAWGSGSDEEEAGGGGGGGAGASRVLHGGGAPAQSRVAQLLLSCSQAGDWTSLVAHLRGLSPSQVDRELRSMELLEGDPPAAERQLELLLRFLEAEAASGANFEFVQALLAAALRVHGEAVAERPALRAAAARVEARVGAAWRRLDGLLQHVRCMVGLLGNLQG